VRIAGPAPAEKEMDGDIPKRFQILSLDGGGIKGLFSAAVLANVEEDLGIRVADHFDLIAGTSTGGIIALGLGLGIRPREIVHFYVEEGPTIFRQVRWWTSLCALWRRKYPQEPLKAALQKYFGDKRLADSAKRLVIPSYSLDKDEVYIFKTPHHERLARDWKEPMWKVALANSAAPTFFPSCRDVDHIRLIDGGIWANNPTVVGIVEAYSMLDLPLQAISTLSLGTTNAVTNKPASLVNGGLLQWKRAAIDAALRGQSHGVQGQAKHLLTEDRAIRLDPPVPDGLFALDKLSEKRLLAEAAHASRNFSPLFKTEFVPHVAERFTPLHPKHPVGV
jgi:patatin-like phospholipase/acyl hydrolase